MRQVALPTALAAFMVTASPAFADATADINVDAGSVATVELVVEITTTFGTDIDDDVVIVNANNLPFDDLVEFVFLLGAYAIRIVEFCKIKFFEVFLGMDRFEHGRHQFR